MLLHWAVSYRTVSNLEKTILDGQGWKRGAGDDSWLERVGIYITFLIVLRERKRKEKKKEKDEWRNEGRRRHQQTYCWPGGPNRTPAKSTIKIVHQSSDSWSENGPQRTLLHLAPSHKIIFRIRQPKISRLEAGVAVRAVVKFRMPS